MRTDIRWQQRFSNFQKAIGQLTKAVVQEHYSELEREGLIQRFVYTFELAWKTLQDFLYFQGYDGINGPKKVITQGLQDVYLQDGPEWLAMLEDFQRTKHTYEQETAERIFEAIRDRYFPLFVQLHSRLEEEEQRHQTQEPTHGERPDA